MSNIFKFHRRTHNFVPPGPPYGEFSTYGGTWSWSGKAIGDGNTNVGYKAGTIKNGSNIQYSLIVCPKSNGQATTVDLAKKFNTTNTAVPATLSALGDGTTTPTGGVAGKYYGSLWDGLSNTNALYSANPTNNLAVAYCKSLTTGGYNDWYLPAKDELELCYRSFKPTTSGNYTGGAYVGGRNASSVPQYNQSYTSTSTVVDGITYPSGHPTKTSVMVFQNGNLEAFTTSAYWCSCMSNNTNSWSTSFGIGMTHGTTSRDQLVYVRPVRRSTL